MGWREPENVYFGMRSHDLPRVLYLVPYMVIFLLILAYTEHIVTKIYEQIS